MSKLDGFRIYSTAEGKTRLVPTSEPFREWRATMWRCSIVDLSGVENQKEVYNDLCSTTQEDCRAKVEKAKRKGWSVSSAPRLITGKDSQ